MGKISGLFGALILAIGVASCGDMDERFRDHSQRNFRRSHNGPRGRNRKRWHHTQSLEWLQPASVRGQW